MNKYHTVKKNLEFAKIIGKGNLVKNRCFVIYFDKNDLNKYRFGISVSKKLGNAVYRNKYKRQLRSIIDKYKKNYQNNMDYIIIIRNGYINLNFEEKEKDFLYLLNKINKFNNNLTQETSKNEEKE